MTSFPQTLPANTVVGRLGINSGPAEAIPIADLNPSAPATTPIPNSTVLGNNTGVAADPIALTQAELTALINQFTSALKGVVPASGGGTANFLRADGSWVAPPTSGGGITDGDKGDITVSGSGTAWTIDPAAVTYAKMQAISATSRLLGRISAGAGSTEELTATQVTGLLNAFTSSLKGLVPSSGGGVTNYLRADGSWTVPPGGGPSTNFADVIYVKESPYNAAVDGITDDTTAIQNAINDAVTNGKVVQLAVGTWIITQLALPTNCKIYGYGMGKSILKRKNTTAITAMLSGTSVSGIQLRDFSIDGNKSNNSGQGNGVLYTGSSKATIEHLEIYECTNSGIVFSLTTDSASARSSIKNCRIYNNNGGGFNFNVAGFTTISHNEVHDCTDGISVFDFRTTNPVAIGVLDNTIITDNTIYNIGGSFGCGIRITGFVDSYTTAGNPAGADLPIVGIDNPSSRNCIIANNVVSTCVGYGIVFQCDSSVLSNNTVHDSGSAGGGGFLANCSRSTITGNNAFNNYNYNMDAGGAQHTAITGNRFGLQLSGNTNLNQGASVRNIVSGNHFMVSAGCIALSISGIDGSDAITFFPWNGRGVVVADNFFETQEATAIGIWVHNGFRNCRATGNSFIGFTDLNAMICETFDGWFSGNVITQSDGTNAPTYPAASDLIIADHAERADITHGGANEVLAILTFSMSVFSQRVMTVQMTNTGSGYNKNSPPFVSFGGPGAGAAGNAAVTNDGRVVGVMITNPGSGYSSIPSVSFSGGGAAAGDATVGANNFNDRILDLQFPTGDILMVNAAGGNLNLGTNFTGTELVLHQKNGVFNQVSRF